MLFLPISLKIPELKGYVMQCSFITPLVSSKSQESYTPLADILILQSLHKKGKLGLRHQGLKQRGILLKREEDYNKGVKKVGVWMPKKFIFCSMKSFFISRLNQPNQTLSCPREDRPLNLPKCINQEIEYALKYFKFKCIIAFFNFNF